MRNKLEEAIEQSIMNEEAVNPYLKIQQEVEGTKGRGPWAYRREIFGKIGLCLLATLTFTFLGLILADFTLGIGGVFHNRDQIKTVRVKTGDNNFTEQTYEELIESQKDALDFDNPYAVNRVVLETSKLSVDSVYPGNPYILYQPQIKKDDSAIWIEKWRFTRKKGDEFPSLDLASISTSLTAGDYILCYDHFKVGGNLQPAKPTEKPKIDPKDERYTLIQDASLLDLVIVRVF